MAIYEGDKQGIPGKGVIELSPKGPMYFDSKSELLRYLKEHGVKITKDELSRWIGDGKKHDGVRYEYERK